MYFWGKKCKIDTFLKKNLLHTETWSTQTKCIIMMTEERSTIIVNVMTLGHLFLYMGGTLKSYSEHALLHEIIFFLYFEA